MESEIKVEVVGKKHFRKYKFTNKKHSKGGIISAICGGVAVFFIIMAIYISFANHGNGGVIISVLGLLSFLISLYGMVKGIRSFKVEDCFYLFSWIGVIVNVIVWIFTAAVIIMGI